MVLWYMGLLLLVFYLIDYYNPLSGIISGMYTFMEDDILKSIVSLVQFVFNSSILPMAAVFIVVASLLGALIGSLAFSGYFQVLNHALECQPKTKGEYVQGFKNNFSRIFLIFIRILFLTFMLILFLMVAVVPAVIATKAAAAGKIGMVAAAVVVDLLTFAVIFFCLMFFRVYAFFWIPAACFHGSKSFKLGKRIADRAFWPIVGKMVVFDIVFILSQYLLSKLGRNAAGFVGRWLFEMFFFTTFVAFIFSTFKKQMDKVS